jgi:hypothetical protein
MRAWGKARKTKSRQRADGSAGGMKHSGSQGVEFGQLGSESFASRGISHASASESGRSCRSQGPRLGFKGPVGDIMLSHCANSQCGRPFLRLGEGKLFLVEAECTATPGDLRAPLSAHARLQPRRVERYWLCDQCAEVWTLVHDRNQGIVLVPVPRPPAGARVAMAEEHRESA